MATPDDARTRDRAGKTVNNAGAAEDLEREPEELLQHIPPAYPAGAVSAFAWAAL